MKKRVVIGSLVVVVMSLIVWSVVRPVLAAQNAMAKVLAIDPRTLTKAEMQKWAERNSWEVVEIDDRMEASIEIRNTVLRTLRLAPPIEFVAFVQFQGSNPAQGAFYLSEQTRLGAYSKVAYIYRPALFSSKDMEAYQVTSNPVGKAPAIILFLNAEADPEIRSQGIGVNVGCLARIGGCTYEEHAKPIHDFIKNNPRHPANPVGALP